MSKTEQSMSNPNPSAEPQGTDDDLAVSDLIEEVSIDGMCGVY